MVKIAPIKEKIEQMNPKRIGIFGSYGCTISPAIMQKINSLYVKFIVFICGRYLLELNTLGL